MDIGSFLVEISLTTLLPFYIQTFCRRRWILVKLVQSYYSLSCFLQDDQEFKISLGSLVPITTCAHVAVPIERVELNELYRPEACKPSSRSR